MSTAYKPRDISLVSADEDNESLASESLIDRHSHFNGLYHTSHDLRVEGSAEGEIECDGTLTVAPEANLDAKVRARNVVIAGVAAGEIMCEDRFTLRPTGQMRGQVLAASLVVEEGAFFEGEFQMSESVEAAKSRRASAPPADFTAVRPTITPSPQRELNTPTDYYAAASDSAEETEDTVSDALVANDAETDGELTDE